MIKKISELPKHHQLFASILIGTSVIAFWRGVWGLLDLYLLPGNEPLSYWVSILIGLVILYLTNYIVKELM